MRILLVSQMYPGRSDPDLGAFVAQMEHALRERGHEIELAVLDHRGGKRRFLELRRRVRAAGPHDVTWAHFLFPSGFLAAQAGGPLVVTAHGRDVRNIGSLPGVASLTERVVERAASVIAVSHYLRRELEDKLPAARGKTEVVDSGVDLDRFSPDVPPAEKLESPAFVHVGSLSERKNVLRLADAFDRLGRGSLTFVGDGPLRPRLEGRPRVRVVGRVGHDNVPGWLTAADVVCAPALIEPFGQAILEAMACARTVVATRVGGPPEFVDADAGLLVDPLDVRELARALATAAEMPSPNEAARAAAAAHDVRRQAERVEEILLRAARGRQA